MKNSFHICLYKDCNEVINYNDVVNIDMCRDLRILTIYIFRLYDDGKCISEQIEYSYDDFDRFEVNEI